MPDYFQVDQPPVPQARKVESHKGDFGHVFVLAGSRGMMGAAALCSFGATRAGAGLVTLGCPASIQKDVATVWPTTMTLALPETFDGTLALGAWPEIQKMLEKVSVVAVGPGLTQHPSTALLVHRVIEQSQVPVVLDADALNAVALNVSVLLSAKAPLILTPHPGEMARLSGKTIAEIQLERRSVAHSFADKYRVTVVLKGAGTVVAGGGQVFVNSTGNPYMASGGTGDVLTGMIAALLAQKNTPFEAARTAVHWHGLAADRAPNAAGPGAVTALDIIDQLRRSADDIDWYNEELRIENTEMFDPDAEITDDDTNGR